jgi:hypothetical protein
MAAVTVDLVPHKPHREMKIKKVIYTSWPVLAPE